MVNINIWHFYEISNYLIFLIKICKHCSVYLSLLRLMISVLAVEPARLHHSLLVPGNLSSLVRIPPSALLLSLLLQPMRGSPSLELFGNPLFNFSLFGFLSFHETAATTACRQVMFRLLVLHPDVGVRHYVPSLFCFSVEFITPNSELRERSFVMLVC